MDALDRMFSKLVYNLRNSFPELLGNPFEVSELYQTVIPYRHNRRELGLESNEDYELTLMALLSGARGYIVGEGRMQETLRAELAKPNPDTSLFRSFATSRIAVATDALRRFDQMGESGAEETPPLGPVSERSASSSRLPESSASRAASSASPPPAFSHPLGQPLYPPPSTSDAAGESARRASRRDPVRGENESVPRASRRDPVRGEAEFAPRAAAHDSAGEAPPRSPTRDARRSDPPRESFRSATAAGAIPESASESAGAAREPARDSVLDRARQARESAREISRDPAREPMPGARASARPSSSPSAPQPPAMTTPTRSTTASALGGSCRYCGGTLPDGRRIVFCPHCGQNLTIQHCPACGTELELEWKYCTTCGRGVAASA